MRKQKALFRLFHRQVIPSNSDSYMKRYLFILSILVINVSCRDNFDLGKLGDTRKIVAYTFPSLNDTTFIYLSGSIPISLSQEKDKKQIPPINNADIKYTINGNICKVHPYKHGYYYVLAKQHVGDIIQMQVSAEGYPAISSSTVIPESVPILFKQINLVSRIDDDYIKTDYYQLQASFSDLAGTEDFYGIKVLIRTISPQRSSGHGNKQKNGMQGNPSAQRDTSLIWAALDIHGEELFKPLSDLDKNLGFSNHFYQYFYIFNDRSINGKSYTLHLNIPTYQTQVQSTNEAKVQFKIFLYKLSPEYYHFLKSLNDIINNDLAKHGLAQITPTFSNITGGIGVMGACNHTQCDWIDLPQQ